MRELNKELMEEVREYYGKYMTCCAEKKVIASDNKAMKEGFINMHFGDESKVDPSEKKRIKKEINKYFRAVEETGSGSDPVIAVRDLRKEHLELSNEQYKELMVIFNAIGDNILLKDKIDDKLDTVYCELGTKLVVSMDVAKGFLKLQYDTDMGKFPVTEDVVNVYRNIQVKLHEKG